MSSIILPLRFMERMTAKVPRFMHEIDRHVEQDAANADRGAGGQADQRVADMADRAVGHQPLDVALVDRGEGAEQHRQDGDEPDDLPPFRGEAAERLDEKADEERDRGDLRRHREERRDRRRRPLVDVGRPHMERHGRDLEGEPDRDEHDADDETDRRAAIGEELGEAIEARRPGEAVDQRGTVEQHAGGQRAEDEVLEPGLGRADRVAVEGGEDVERQALQSPDRDRG